MILGEPPVSDGWFFAENQCTITGRSPTPCHPDCHEQESSGPGRVPGSACYQQSAPERPSELVIFGGARRNSAGWTNLPGSHWRGASLVRAARKHWRLKDAAGDPQRISLLRHSLGSTVPTRRLHARPRSVSTAGIVNANAHSIVARRCSRPVVSASVRPAIWNSRRSMKS